VVDDHEVSINKELEAFDLSKRFWLFHGATYYPGGGIYDLRGTYDELSEAQVKYKSQADDYTWGHCFDMQEKLYIDLDKEEQTND
jgi:hypothetical protein